MRSRYIEQDSVLVKGEGAFFSCTIRGEKLYERLKRYPFSRELLLPFINRYKKITPILGACKWCTYVNNISDNEGLSNMEGVCDNVRIKHFFGQFLERFLILHSRTFPLHLIKQMNGKKIMSRKMAFSQDIK